MKGTFKVIVKPGAKRNEVSGFDEQKKAYLVSIKAPAHEGKANVDLIKFLSKEFKGKFRIKLGAKSKEKIIERLSP